MLSLTTSLEARRQAAESEMESETFRKQLAQIPESLVEMSPYAGASTDDKFLRNLISYMSSQ